MEWLMTVNLYLAVVGMLHNWYLLFNLVMCSFNYLYPCYCLANSWIAKQTSWIKYIFLPATHYVSLDFILNPTISESDYFCCLTVIENVQWFTYYVSGFIISITVILINKTL